ncbi:MAG: VacJ family lipoprotein [Gallionellaceae bacterium]|nr:VacJ family lipoprotein [Gallionellaceae bacterium]
MSAIRIFLLLVSLVLGGCASTHHNPKDPLESFNRGMYQFNDTVDKYALKPVAQGYNTAVPRPVKLMISNFFSNLNDITVAINNLLQLKIADAASDCGRVVINSTIGLLGIADVATPIGLKKHNEDFGQTLGYWGVGSGPYLMLPFLGPSSIRDGVGLATDSTTDVVWRIDPVDVRNGTAATRVVDTRADLLDKEKVLDTAAVDRYAFIRDAYLQRRRSLVYDGDPPREKFEDE